jgi:uncharacterized ion transporter superfamily protein YfcC
MKKFPNAFVIIIGVILFAWLLTYIIPQGSFERTTDAATGTTMVVKDSYQTMDGNTLSIFDLLLAVPKGIAGSADVIVLILLLGGCFYVIEKTGALAQGLQKLTDLLEGRERVGLLVVTALFTAAGASIGMQEEVIALMPMLLLFGRGLGFNALTMLYASYGSTVIGSSFGPSNPFAVLLAQKEAGLPLLSGSGLRFGALLLAFALWALYLWYYANRTKMPKTVMAGSNTTLTFRSKVILTLLALTFGLVVYGLLYWNWGFQEITALFFGLGLVAGILGKLGLEETSEAYISGFREMIFAAMIIGLADSISVILEQGMIMDTIVYGLFGPLQYLPASLSGVLMMLSHAVLHFPIPSYTGQAVMTMPILVPLSDLIGLSRQTCVLAFQYGAVLADLFVPTNGTLMAVLALSGITYDRWIKFIVKPVALIFLLAALTMIYAVAVGYA